MSVASRVRQAFARKTEPENDGARPIARIPVRRGNIFVTHDKALELSTCFACVRVISEDVAKLPWNVFQQNGNSRTRLDKSSLSRLLNTRPNPDIAAFTFRETLMAWALTWGNGYAEIERDMGGRPIALWPIPPDRVEPRRAADGRVVYEINNSRRESTYLEQRDIFHVHGIGFDGLCGYSMVGLAAQTLGFAIAAEEHGASFYGNNTTPGLALKTDGVLNDSGFERLKEQMEERKGSARAYEGMILEQGLDFARPNMSQVDAQYVETRRLAVEEVCRWWRVPPHKVQELSRAHFANVENLNIDYATDTLMPWVKRLEEEADWKLISPRSQASYTKIAIQGLMRGDSAARAAFYKDMFQMGVFSPNMILTLEDMDPIGPEGDEHYIQSQFTTLKKINEEPEPMPLAAPFEIAEEAVQNLIARHLGNDLRKADSKRGQTNRETFEDWLTQEHEKNRYRREQSFLDVAVMLREATGKEVNIHRGIAAYFEASHTEVMNYFDGERADCAAITSAFLEAIK